MGISEIENLKHDIERHLKIVGEQAAEIIELQQKLAIALGALIWIRNHPYAEAHLLVQKAEKVIATFEADIQGDNNGI